MELDADALVVVRHRRDRAGGCLTDDMKARRWRADAIAVAHPYRQLRVRSCVYASEQCVIGAITQGDLGGTILAPSGVWLDPPAKLVREQVHAVADAENRQ